MRASIRMLAVGSGLLMTGCLTGFRHPLGPAGDGFVDQQLCARWSCTSADPETALLTIVDFDGRQYYLEVVEPGKNEPSRYRGHATRVEGRSFLSVQELGRDRDEDWTILEYDLASADRLRLRYVDPDAFEDVIDDPDAVRDILLASGPEDTEVVNELLSCARSEAGRP